MFEWRKAMFKLTLLNRSTYTRHKSHLIILYLSIQNVRSKPMRMGRSRRIKADVWTDTVHSAINPPTQLLRSWIKLRSSWINYKADQRRRAPLFEPESFLSQKSEHSRIEFLFIMKLSNTKFVNRIGLSLKLLVFQTKTNKRKLKIR